MGEVDLSVPLSDLSQSVFCLKWKRLTFDFSLKFILNSGACCALGEIDKESCPDSRINEKNIAFKKISKMGLKQRGNNLVDFLSNTTNYFPRSSFLGSLTSVLFIPEELLKMKFLQARILLVKPGEIRFLYFKFKMNKQTDMKYVA